MGEYGRAPREHTATIVVSAGAERRSREACLPSISRVTIIQTYMYLP